MLDARAALHPPTTPSTATLPARAGLFRLLIRSDSSRRETAPVVPAVAATLMVCLMLAAPSDACAQIGEGNVSKSAAASAATATVVAGQAEAEAVPATSPDPKFQARALRDLQRQRIERERAQAQAQLDAEKARCRQRFAVIDCTREAQERYNRHVGDLRRQEVLLNDEERKARTDAKRGDLEQREQQQQEREAQPERVRAGDPKPANEPSGSGLKDIEAHQREQARRKAQRDDEAARRVEQAQRQREDAEDRRRRAQQREAERKDKPAASLPTPP